MTSEVNQSRNRNYEIRICVLLNNLETWDPELKEEIHRGFLVTDNCRQLKSEFKILIYEVDFK